MGHQTTSSRETMAYLRYKVLKGISMILVTLFFVTLIGIIPAFEEGCYRGSPVSAVFGSPANRTIGKTALIED